MANNANSIPPVLTPGGNIAPSQQLIPPGVQIYIDNGLTYQSNNSDFIKRDDNGNIIVNQGVSNNQNLVLEALSLRYVNDSVIRNIDTRFKYFRFPAENIAVPEISFNLTDVIDPLFALYSPSNNFPITATGIPVGILMDVVNEGIPQLNTNQYYINNIVKESGQDLRFRIRLNHRYATAGGGNTTGTIFFTIIKADFNTAAVIRDFRILTSNADAIINSGNTLTKEYDIVIPNNDFNIGDSFQIGALVGQYNPSGNVEVHTILKLGSYWSITNAALDVNINNEPN
jgi:hypothetical protein